MKRLEATTRENVRVKFYNTTRQGKLVIRAQLTDEHGDKIEGASASYTMGSVDTEEQGKIAARNKALEKLDSMYRDQHTDESVDKKTYFSSIWNALSASQRKRCVGDLHGQDGTKKGALTYFEGTTVGLLDQYGAGINVDQARAVVEGMLEEMLKRKKYTHCFVTEEDAHNTRAFFKALVQNLIENRREMKVIFGHHIVRESMEELLESVKVEVLQEDRLRSLTELWLQGKKLSAAIAEYRHCVESDAELLDLLDHKNKHAKAKERIIHILRLLSGNELQTKSQVNRHVKDANCILRNLCKLREDMPVVVLPEYIVEKVPQIELCKELPWTVRVYFTKSCMSQISQNDYACGGIIMMVAGPRVAEVCAIQFGDIIDMGDWGVCMINYTADGDIRRDEGKNIYFRRPIFFPKIAMDAVHARMDALRKRGLSDEGIRTAFLVSRPENVHLPAKKHAFSDAIKDLLQEAGCAEEYWTAVQRAMVEEPDLDHLGRAEKSIVAYALRRDATSMMCNVAKIDPLIVDAILGHRLPTHRTEWTEKIRHDDEWPAIIAQMERIVYDPDHSKNPVFAPVELGNEMVGWGNEVAYQGVTLSAPCKCRVLVSIKTVGNSKVFYNLPTSSEQKMNTRTVLRTDGPYCSIAPLNDRDDYEKVKSLTTKKQSKPQERRKHEKEKY